MKNEMIKKWNVDMGENTDLFVKWLNYYNPLEWVVMEQIGENVCYMFLKCDDKFVIVEFEMDNEKYITGDITECFNLCDFGNELNEIYMDNDFNFDYVMKSLGISKLHENVSRETLKNDECEPKYTIYNDINEMYYDITRKYVNEWEFDKMTFMCVMEMLNELQNKLFINIGTTVWDDYKILMLDDCTGCEIIFKHGILYIPINYMLCDDDTWEIFQCYENGIPFNHEYFVYNYDFDIRDLFK